MYTPCWFRSLAAILVVPFLAFAIAGCGESGDPAQEDNSTAVTLSDSSSLASVIETDDRFTTLQTALDSSGLDSTLASAGPYTLFAPTNAAFDRLPEGTVPDLLDRENRDRLRMILTHHVVQQKLMSEDVSGMAFVNTMEGSSVPVSADDGTLRVGSATVLDADIVTGNGVIHVIDSVLRPPVMDNDSTEP
ncbi:hypothetical protein CRI94_10100 [Longibacter salinarum]|uniref:FAS1 domain-containing protein n=1 Tax=Longibacter salinarum TaxID=1850348 RepID=A0A2A8CYJ2_9BACT|nr:fasciclin domain-containing protein [Longibacter salinarum]PEN13647.1 hypothetical protein CRI94_10100 [Longibacter salinarum]